MRNLLVFERSDRLEFRAGLPEKWHGRPLRVEGMPTPEAGGCLTLPKQGRVCVTFRSDEE